MVENSVVVLGSGATANLAFFKWSDHYDRISERCGVRCAETHPACARFESGDGLVVKVRRAVDVPVRLPGNRGKFTAFVLEADILVLLRRGAPDAPGGQSGFPSDISALRKQGV